MSAAVLLIIAAAPAATLFPLLYGLIAPWWRTGLVGWALLVDAAALGLLIDVSLLYHFLDDRVPDWVRLPVYTFIVVGVWLRLAAFVVEHFRRRRRVTG